MNLTPHPDDPRGHVVLENSSLRVTLDPTGGADVLSLVDRASETELLFSTPWRPRADDVRSGRERATSGDSWSRWLEGYRGGWQLLCPNAGPARSRHGVELGFHGEASLRSWHPSLSTSTRVDLQVELFHVPLSIQRRVELIDDAIEISDRVENVSPSSVKFDYVSHPAFGGPFVEGGLTLVAPECLLVEDVDGGVPRRTRHLARNGRVDLADVAIGGSFLGWLEGEGVGDVALLNEARGLSLRLQWDRTLLPHAWVWAELGGSRGFPWFGRAYAVAIEPSSCPTGGPGRESSLITLPPHSAAEFTVRLSVSQST